jgi:hypothetical protein
MTSAFCGSRLLHAHSRGIPSHLHPNRSPPSPPTHPLSKWRLGPRSLRSPSLLPPSTYLSAPAGDLRPRAPLQPPPSLSLSSPRRAGAAVLEAQRGRAGVEWDKADTRRSTGAVELRRRAPSSSRVPMARSGRKSGARCSSGIGGGSSPSPQPAPAQIRRREEQGPPRRPAPGAWNGSGSEARPSSPCDGRCSPSLSPLRQYVFTSQRAGAHLLELGPVTLDPAATSSPPRRPRRLSLPSPSSSRSPGTAGTACFSSPPPRSIPTGRGSQLPRRMHDRLRETAGNLSLLRAPSVSPQCAKQAICRCGWGSLLESVLPSHCTLEKHILNYCLIPCNAGHADVSDDPSAPKCPRPRL